MARNQITVLKQYEHTIQMDKKFDTEQFRIFEAADELYCSIVAAQQDVYFKMNVIANILSFCGRHWFDQLSLDRKRIRHRKRYFPPKGTCQQKIYADAHREGPKTLPGTLEKDWSTFEHEIQVGRCSLRFFYKEMGER